MSAEPLTHELALRELFHELRRALNGATLQLEVARLDAPGDGARLDAPEDGARLDAQEGGARLQRALSTASEQLLRLSDALDRLEERVLEP